MCDNHPEFVTHWLRALPAKFQFIGLSTETDMHIVKFENPSFFLCRNQV